MNYKKCNKCGAVKEATTENFHRKKGGKDGLNAVCKVCKNAIDLKRLSNDKPRMARNYRNYVNNNPHAKITQNLRARMRKVIKKGFKSGHSLSILGCSSQEWKVYLESKFTDGMSWENYGEWHIDHIVPCASFDLTKEEDQIRCFHYTNTQPLWKADNYKKGCKVDYEFDNT